MSQLLPQLIQTITQRIAENAEEVTRLDQAIGDGDHVINLQRGLNALKAQSEELAQLDWQTAFKKIGMTLLTTMGGASGSLFGTLFLSMSKATTPEQTMTLSHFADIFNAGVEAVKKRGKADAGEKTMLDVLIPAVESIQNSVKNSMTTEQALLTLAPITITAMEATRDMLATKGRASFLGERSIGHIDAGAKTSQLMICTIIDVLTAPA